ncbi:uncharacterized protein DUF1800 [Chitinophaga skermanii]|uniref:Uncharacterized protein DUF1800 n=1 Tax=Chitinophaga skermanii TaxID=331697 RepID=A0A327QHT8_9BACT|nr:DUF1800 domain-containing protein [Chitinophaga skermanii]RAJ04119.1 uncharacterized protein DUF1800 [Chitinophaga skermanii]
MTTEKQVVELQHLAWRAGFGEQMQTIQTWQSMKRKKLIDQILIGKQNELPPITVISLPGIPAYKRAKDMSAEERKAARKLNIDGIKQLNVQWLSAMVNSEHPLREKMALFWHGHFACRTQNVLYNQQLLQIIRENALGNFGELLTAVSKSAAMLQFLNNQQNRKAHPNENFAREVMELFTMGRGNYSEQDVKEAARSFTGWGFNELGEFQFRERLHDEDEKTLLGKRGNFDGDDVLKILLEHRATATYITKKLYAFFVNDVPHDAHIQALADIFYRSNYNIKTLMKAMFEADWFYDASNMGSHIKSPVELLVGLRKRVPMQFENEDVMLLFERVLGQLLFYPPNVAGWPGGRSWIDSSSLMFRMRVPQIIFYSQPFNIVPKEVTPEMGEGNNYKVTAELNKYLAKQYGNKVKATIQWEQYIAQYENIPREQLAARIAADLLGVNNKQPTSSYEQFADKSSRENFIRTVTVNIMSTPAYQLC